VRWLLWGALAALLFMNYEAWMRDYPPTPATVGTSADSAGGKPANALGDSVPLAASAPATAAPAASDTNAAAGAPGVSTAPTLALPAAAADSGAATAAPPLHVVTDVLDISINLKGGQLDRADLLEYPLRKDTPGTPVRLLSREPPSALYLLQSGLAGAPGESAPTHLALWTSDSPTYTLTPGADELRVPLTWSDQGLTVTKTFVFKRGQYAIALEYEVKNEGTADRKLASYAQILRHWEHASRSYFDVETYSFKGPAVYDGSKSKDLNVESDTESKYSASITGGWLASLQHQFVTAIVPPAGQAFQYQLQVRGKEYLLSATGPTVDIPPGGKASFHEELFVGP
jgi:YidC/Oxa1 family membrane protein insertase